MSRWTRQQRCCSLWWIQLAVLVCECWGQTMLEERYLLVVLLITLLSLCAWRSTYKSKTQLPSQFFCSDYLSMSKFTDTQIWSVGMAEQWQASSCSPKNGSKYAMTFHNHIAGNLKLLSRISDVSTNETFKRSYGNYWRRRHSLLMWSHDQLNSLRNMIHWQNWAAF